MMLFEMSEKKENSTKFKDVSTVDIRQLQDISSELRREAQPRKRPQTDTLRPDFRETEKVRLQFVDRLPWPASSLGKGFATLRVNNRGNYRLFQIN